MAEIDRILTLHTTEHSNREIADLLGVDRENGRQVRGAGQGPKPAKRAHRDGGADGDQADAAGQNRPNAPTGSDDPASGPPSECEPFREPILAKIAQGFQARANPPGLGRGAWRSAPELLQRAAVRRPADAEDAAAVSTDGDRARRGGPGGLRHRRAGPHGRWQACVARGSSASCFSYSRKAYSEAVWRQTTESFLQCLENAFRHFGGVPKRLVIDNLKAAVARPTGTTPRSIPNSSRSPSTTARCSCPPSRTRRATRARSKAA